VADVAILFLAALVIVAGACAVLMMTPAAKRKRRLASEARKRRVSPSADDLDSYLSRLSQAESEQDIDRLEKGEG
jgi:hypothetical protein